MAALPDGELTRMLRGGAATRAELLERIHGELRALAQRRMRDERRAHTLQATALVHEAWLRLSGDAPFEWRDRGHFFAAAAEAMRRVLIDHARRAGAEKRGGAHERITLGAADVAVELPLAQALELHDALATLAREDERAAAVAQLRFLSGLSVEETAAALDLSVRSVHREWEFAKARLAELLGGATDR